MKANTLVRYHGSKRRYHGLVMRVLGRCRCVRCVHWGDVRWRLAYRGDAVTLMWCVRPQSFTRVTVAGADEIERRARDDAEHGLTDWDGRSPDAYVWSPSLPIPVRPT